MKKRLETFGSQYKPPAYTGPEDSVDYSPQFEAAVCGVLSTGATTATAALTICTGLGFLAGVALNRS